MHTPRLTLTHPAQPERLGALSVSLTPDPRALGQRLEFTARGERVTARVRIPAESAPPYPLAIFIDDTDQESPSPEAECFLAQGIATVQSNWPLLGSRRSPKMSRQLLSELAQRGAQRGIGEPSVLIRQFLAQAEEEFSCLIDATAAIREINPLRILHLEFSLTPIPSANSQGEASSTQANEAIRHRQGQGKAEKAIEPEDAPPVLATFLRVLRG
jgi:hypothetical protein